MYDSHSIEEIQNKLGECFCQLCEIYDTSKFIKYGSIWYDLAEKYSLINDLYRTVKMFKSGQLPYQQLNILLEIIKNHTPSDLKLTGTKLIIIGDDFSSKVRILRNIDIGDLAHYGYTISDFYSNYDMSTLTLYIDTLVSFKENAGSRFLQYCKNIGVAILFEAGYLFLYDEESNPEYLDKLVEYYIELGFTDVNNYIGCYDTKVTMLYIPTSESAINKDTSVLNMSIDEYIIEELMRQSKPVTLKDKIRECLPTYAMSEEQLEINIRNTVALF